MFNITLKYYIIFNNMPPASWVAHIRRDFLAWYCYSFYSSMDQSRFCISYLLGISKKKKKKIHITLKYFCIFNNIPYASWVAHIARDFLKCYSCSYYSFMLSVLRGKGLGSRIRSADRILQSDTEHYTHIFSIFCRWLWKLFSWRLVSIRFYFAKISRKKYKDNDNVKETIYDLGLLKLQ